MTEPKLIIRGSEGRSWGLAIEGSYIAVLKQDSPTAAWAPSAAMPASLAEYVSVFRDQQCMLLSSEGYPGLQKIENDDTISNSNNDENVVVASVTGVALHGDAGISGKGECAMAGTKDKNLIVGDHRVKAMFEDLKQEMYDTVGLVDGNVEVCKMLIREMKENQKANMRLECLKIVAEMLDVSKSPKLTTDVMFSLADSFTKFALSDGEVRNGVRFIPQNFEVRKEKSAPKKVKKKGNVYHLGDQPRAG